MYILPIFFTLFSFLVSSLFGRLFGSRGVIIITVLFMFCTVFSSLFIFYEVVLCNSICSLQLFFWINCEYLSLKWGFFYDSLTSIMLLVVNIISLLVHIFSINYMSEDPHLSRFMSYLSLFTFFMLILITSDNFVQMFLGWEGVGLASFLLISFWFTRYQAVKSALKAIILNRIGDFCLILGIACIFSVFKSLNYITVFSTIHYFVNDVIYLLNIEIYSITFISFFLFLGAVGKSAQLGLHMWLPDAMEGPTPVSALIHAATMVTAGVFLLIRCSYIFEYSKFILIFIVIVGSLTCFFAATTGLVQDDIKKVIAYSTCSQLGYMIFSCGLSNYSGSLFHLSNHAFFKALLFLSAGAIIHSLNDEQDMRKMGGLFKLLPFIYIMFLIGSLSLMGFPFLTGYYSKDFILELSYSNYKFYGYFSFCLGSFSAFFTAFYSFRLIYLTFLSKTNSYKKYIENTHEVGIIMSIPLIILSFGSIFIGFFFKDMIIGLGTNFWNNTLFFLSENFVNIETEFLLNYIKLIPTILSFFGLILCFFFYFFYSFFYFFFFKSNKFYFKFIFINIYYFFSKKWYFDYYSNFYIVKLILRLGYEYTFKLIDRGIIEYIGPLGFVRLFNNLSKKINKLQSGYLFNYILGIIFFIILFIFFLLDSTSNSNINNILELLYIYLIIVLLILKSLNK